MAAMGPLSRWWTREFESAPSGSEEQKRSDKEELRKLEQRGIKLEDLADLGDIYMCYAKNSSELEDPIGWYGWCPLEGIISDERLKALEAGTEPTDREMQLMRDEVVRGSDQQRCRMKYICFELQLPKVLPNSVPARP